VERCNGRPNLSQENLVEGVNRELVSLAQGNKVRGNAGKTGFFLLIYSENPDPKVWMTTFTKFDFQFRRGKRKGGKGARNTRLETVGSNGIMWTKDIKEVEIGIGGFLN
jgi:hypothetical protein